MDNIIAVLSAAGLSADEIVSTTLYIEIPSIAVSR